MRSSRNLRWSELRSGIVIVVALALLALGILQLGNRVGLFTSNYPLYIYMDDSRGLKAGSIVRLAGLSVGNVDDINFSTDPRVKKIVVKISIRKEYMDRIRQDSVASIKTVGLLGDKYVDISVGSPESPVLPPGGVLREIKESQFTNVLSGASSGLEALNVVLGQLKDILGDVTNGAGTAGKLLKDPELYNQLRDSAENIQRVAASLRDGKGSAGKLVNDPQLYNNLLDVSSKTRELIDRLNRGSLIKLSEDKTFYDNLSEISTNLKDVSRSAKALTDNLNKGNFSKLSSDKELFAKIERVSTRLDDLSARLESGKGSAGKLLKDEALYNNMNKFFEDADTLVLDFKKNPRKYIKLSIF